MGLLISCSLCDRYCPNNAFDTSQSIFLIFQDLEKPYLYEMNERKYVVKIEKHKSKKLIQKELAGKIPKVAYMKWKGETDRKSVCPSG
jgi:hypothetical protein